MVGTIQLIYGVSTVVDKLTLHMAFVVALHLMVLDKMNRALPMEFEET